MKTKLFGLVMILANALAACDSTTDTLGNSLTEDIDQLIISTDTFAVDLFWGVIRLGTSGA